MGIAPGRSLEIGERLRIGRADFQSASGERETLLLTLNHLKKRRLPLLIRRREIALGLFSQRHDGGSIGIEYLLKLHTALTCGSHLGFNGELERFDFALGAGAFSPQLTQSALVFVAHWKGNRHPSPDKVIGVTVPAAFKAVSAADDHIALHFGTRETLFGVQPLNGQCGSAQIRAIPRCGGTVGAFGEVGIRGSNQHACCKG